MSVLFYGCVNYNQQSGDVFNVNSLSPLTIGQSFMSKTWYGCTSLTTAVVPDTSNWRPTIINNTFMNYTWYGCTSLTTAVVPDTSNWRPTIINDTFMEGTWGDCTSLTTAVAPDTTNWNISSINTRFLYETWRNCASLTTAVIHNTTNWNVTGNVGSYFMTQTWYSCSKLTTAVAPDTTNWSVSSVSTGFMSSTWVYAFPTSGGTIVTLRGNLYVSFPLTTNSAAITNTRVANIKVDPVLISTYQSSSSWSNITPSSKFISW